MWYKTQRGKCNPQYQNFHAILWISLGENLLKALLSVSTDFQQLISPVQHFLWIKCKQKFLWSFSWLLFPNKIALGPRDRHENDKQWEALISDKILTKMMKSISEESDNKPAVTAYPMNDELVQ